MTKKISLAALGWVEDDSPVGNRLRWHYPVDDVQENRYRGLPKTIIVERAQLNESDRDMVLDIPCHNKMPLVPLLWWVSIDGVISLEGFLPKIYQLDQPAQAIVFYYDGNTTQLKARDSDGRIVFDCEINNGKYVCLKAPEISSLEFYTPSSVSISKLKVLDLYGERYDLKWEEIARINVADTIFVKLDEVEARYGSKPTLTEEEWSKLKQFVIKEALTSNPPDDTSWNEFQMILGTRWEYAVLFGFGFLDGPRQDWGHGGELRKDKILKGMPTAAVAYRVRDPDRLGSSNIVVCPPSGAKSLLPPKQPEYINPEVRLTVDLNSQDPNPQPRFLATYRLRWKQTDPLAISVKVTEHKSKSLLTPATQEDLEYVFHTRQLNCRRFEGIRDRSEFVAFHDVQLQCRMQAIDGWDRLSGFSAYTPWTPLFLIHNPIPPSLASASWADHKASLVRQIKDPNDFPDWTPDLVVQNDPSAKIFVYRNKIDSNRYSVSPARELVTIESPVQISENLFSVKVNPPINLEPFDGGFLISKSFKAVIQKVSDIDKVIFFNIGSGDSTLPNTGQAELRQNPLHLNLWVNVSEFPVPGLPENLIFDDGVATSDDRADVLSYHTRISFLTSRVGPPSNIVQAIRKPNTLNPPPPFTVDLLGVDFYNRTMVKITFNEVVSDGIYTVWWANGNFCINEKKSEFAKNATPGIQRAQTPYLGQYLFDVLAIPLPTKTNKRSITIGVERVTSGGGQSKFEMVEVKL